MIFLDRLVANPLGLIVVLALAAFLEAWGDSFFQVSFYRSSGMGRILAFAAGAVVLACYGAVVNTPRWDFGKLLGVYVVLFFIVAQVLAKMRFGQSPTPPVYVGRRVHRGWRPDDRVLACVRQATEDFPGNVYDPNTGWNQVRALPYVARERASVCASEDFVTTPRRFSRHTKNFPEPVFCSLPWTRDLHHGI